MNNRSYITIILYVLIFLRATGLWAQEQYYSEEYTSPRKDTLHYYSDGELHPRIATKPLREKYTGDDYKYEYQFKGETTSLWERFKKWIIGLLRKWFELDSVKEANKYFDRLIKFIYVIIFSVVMYFIIRTYYRNEGVVFIGRNDQALDIYHREIIDDIHSNDYQELINRAESEKDYRNAVRFAFLQILKQLSGLEIIDWGPYKTNSDYSREIQSADLRKEFNSLAYIYDYYWYGKFPLNKVNYISIKELFERFRKHLAT